MVSRIVRSRASIDPPLSRIGQRVWLFNGQRATREQMESVLSEVTNFLIQAEYISGSDWMRLDEVEILAPNVGGVGGGFPSGG